MCTPLRDTLTYEMQSTEVWNSDDLLESMVVYNVKH